VRRREDPEERSIRVRAHDFEPARVKRLAVARRDLQIGAADSPGEAGCAHLHGLTDHAGGKDRCHT
jgi:hypothetical protein